MIARLAVSPMPTARASSTPAPESATRTRSHTASSPKSEPASHAVLRSEVRIRANALKRSPKLRAMSRYVTVTCSMPRLRTAHLRLARRGRSAASVDPVQYVPRNRPPPRLRHGGASEDPVVVERLDGSVLSLQVDPGVDQAGQSRIVAADYIRERHFHPSRFRHDDGQLRMQQGPRRAALGRQGQRVHPRVTWR